MNNYESGGISKSLATLGKACGLAAALLGTPAIWVRTRGMLFGYFTEAWGYQIGKWCAWAACGLEAFSLYAVVNFAFTLLVSWVLAKRAAESFAG